MARPRVVIVGGGFGGLYAARALRRAPVAVALVDKRNHHLFQPLLYQVATAALNPADIAAPLRRVLRRQRNAEVLLATVTGVDLQRRSLLLLDGELAYDFLILSPGASHSYFGNAQWAPFAPGLKTIEDATDIRRRVLLAFEAAERERDAARRLQWMTFVIVGAGPTGVELAGALAEIAGRVLTRDFRHNDPRSAHIVLLEAAPRVLPSYAPDVSARAAAALQRLGVDVRTSVIVQDVGPWGVTAADTRLEARTVLWAAGVAASPLGRALGVPLDRAGRVIVAPDLTVPGHPEVFVIGDLASVTQDGRPVPGVAPAAMQEARHSARNIERRLRHQPSIPFRYHDRGLLATIGRGAAVAQLGRFHFGGFVAWLMWLFIHIIWLIGFRNRAIVLLEWAWAYMRFERGARLIVGDVGPLVAPQPQHP